MLPPAGDDPWTVIRRLERRLEALEGSRRVGSTAVQGDDAATVWLDDLGVEKVRAGALGGGAVGLRSIGGEITGGTVNGTTVNGAYMNGGTVRTPNLILVDGSDNDVPLSRLITPKIGATAADMQFGNSTAFPSGTVYAKNTWVYDTNLNQTVTAAQFLDITITCRLTVNVANGALYAGVRVLSGATTITAAALSRAMLVRYYSVGQAAQLQASLRVPVSLSSSGTFTIAPAYYLDSVGATDAAGIVNNRNIFVQGF